MDMGLLILKSLNSLVSRPLVDLKIFDVFVVGNRRHANENHYTVLTSPGRTSPQPGRLFAQHIWLARKDHLFQHWVIFVFLEWLNFRTHPYRHRLVGWHKNSPASVYRSGLLFGAYLWFLYPWATQELFDSNGHTGCILMWVEEFAVHTKLANWLEIRVFCIFLPTWLELQFYLSSSWVIGLIIHVS